MSLAHLPRSSAIACVAVPLLAVLAIRTFLPGGGPTTAGASTTPTAPASRDVPKVRDIHDPPELVQAVRDALAAPAGPCVVAAPLERVEVRTPAPPKANQSKPVFALTSVAGGGSTSIAMIDGKVRRPGDDLGRGWSVSTIDRTAGVVTLAGPDGDSMTLTLRKDR